KRRLITSYEIFKNKKFSLSDVKTLGDRELIGYSLSDPIIYADGSLLESETTKKIYFVKNAEKRYVVSDKALKENKLNKKKTIKVSDRELEYYKNGGVVALPEGTLITDLKKKDYYIVEDGGKKKVSDHNVFLANKLNKKKEIKLAKKDLDLYPEKGYVLYPDGTLIKKENAPEIYVVKENKLNWIQTMEEFKRSKYSMKKVIPLASSEFSKYALASAIASVEKKPEKIIEVAAVKTDIQPVAPQKISIYKNIRIAISEIQKDEEVRVTANGDFNMTSKNGTQKYNIGETAVIKWQGAGDIKFQALNPNTIFEILTYKDTNWNKTINFNKFRGSLEVAYSKKSDKVYVINELPFEEYLLGIGEALNSDQKEYQKAFAVSSRSYAAFHLLNGGKRGSDEIYHLNNTPSDQVYRGYNWEVYAPNLVSAVKETAGEVMKYNGKVARSVYSSDSGGITKNACALWDGVFCSEDYDYLVGGVHDPEGTERRSQTDIAKSHGVGMSATGGRRLAELGKNYKDILLYYYKGVTIENLN
ncbi:hypothetical protein HY249_01850, partial [Candidatus Azambacteria bacterium]|nr:hypothetical protein [Candidatus Azambacteria bacterium]